MKNKVFLELADVKAIAAAAEAEALKNNWAVSIAIVDDGGHLLWQQRLDGAAGLTSYIAPAKAHTAEILDALRESLREALKKITMGSIAEGLHELASAEWK